MSFVYLSIYCKILFQLRIVWLLVAKIEATKKLFSAEIINNVWSNDFNALNELISEKIYELNCDNFNECDSLEFVVSTLLRAIRWLTALTNKNECNAIPNSNRLLSPKKIAHSYMYSHELWMHKRVRMPTDLMLRHKLIENPSENVVQKKKSDTNDRKVEVLAYVIHKYI